MKRLIHLILLMLFVFEAEVFSQESEQAYPPHALLNAAYLGDIQMMKHILQTNPDKDLRDALGGTALHIAIFSNNLEAMQLLLDHGFDINAVSPRNGYTPLHYCVWFNNVNAARFLIMNNANRNIRDNNGMTPLEMASKEGKRDIILLLSRR
jgi:ankyrin repeat protein